MNALNMNKQNRVSLYTRFNYYSALIVFSILLFSACSDKRSKEIIPDVDNIKIEVNLQRLDSLFALSDKNKAVSSIIEFHEDNPFFSEIYFKTLVPIDDNDKNNFEKNLMDLLENEQIANLIDTTQIVFPDLNLERKKLYKALQFYKHYFPEATIPNFYSLISEFGVQSFIFQDNKVDGVGIGLDMFLGEDFNYKKVDPRNEAFSDYLSQNYSREFIVKRCMEVILEDKMGTQRGSNLLSQMINDGKMLYILNKILPEEKDEIVLGFNTDQLAWLADNEIEMWSFFLENELLYETSQAKTFKYLNPSPSSPGMPAQAPGRTAVYIGFKIVENYMKRNPSTSIQELITMDDYQKIISKYKPPRK